MKKIYTLLVAFISFVIIPVNIFGEGSDEIWVDAPGNKTKLYLCSDFDTQCDKVTESELSLQFTIVLKLIV
ncbi:MAG: hypothetical protein U5Q03_08035 [Bacteroidota bacterium]|nr:hypothetical protein [Bacteroidota bacterium]